ncbi:MAG TPA: 50S ribosomal protein L11 methyltransferase [Burkholderiales bacterium]|nr:50S ribosomal protein L11 methyltransferase [Burkholderiales bacterium]
MPWFELRFVCAEREAEAFSDALMEAGALSVSVEDADANTAQEQPLFGEPGMAIENTAWRRNVVVALIDAEADAPALAREAASAAGYAEVPPYTTKAVADQDWVRLTQSQFEPIRISERLWIVPSWHEPPDPKALAIRLDPGLAFGTGSHPTTRLCLQWLDTHIKGGESVLDYGCGSGILAVAAAKFGAAPVFATDIDPQALIASRDNAQANGCTLEIRNTDALTALTADVVVANILTNPLKVLAPALVGHVKPGGRLTLSGILDSQEDEVIAAYRPLIALTAFRREDGWTCLSGTKN